MNTQDLQKKIGHGLKVARRRADLTGAQAAERLGIAQSSLQRWENGRCAQPFWALWALAVIYNTTPNGILIDAGMSPSELDLSALNQDAA